MKKSLSIILNLLLILSFAAFGYSAEEYVYVTKWTPDGNPRGMATDSDGNVYIAGEQKIVKYTRDGMPVFTIQNIPNNDDYNLSSWDMAVAVDSSGYIYVSNEQDNNVIKFDSSGSYVTKWGSQGSEDDQFTEPKGIAIDNNGYVYVCDRGNQRIVKFDTDGTFIKSFGQEGWEDGQFQRPRDIAIDTSSSEIYVTEEWNSRIQVFDLEGTFKRKWATDSSAGDGEINSPKGIALDSQGNVYVSDEEWMDNRIVKFASDGTFILKFGGYGTDNYHFHGLQGIAIDYSDNVYVIDLQNWDWENRRILKYRLVGSPTIQITNPTENEFVSGPVTIQATVTVAAGYTLSKVEFYLDTTNLGEVTSSPYEKSLDTTAYTNGAYTIWVAATNTESVTSREKVSIVVANGDDAPTVSITNPADQEQIMGTVDIQADASDDVGIAKVEFYADDIKLAEATSSPYTCSWDTTTVQDGEMIVKAIAYDTIGQTAEASIYVAVTNAEEYSYIAQWYSDNPRSIALDQNGNLYVAGGHKIRKFSSDGTELMTIEDNGGIEYRFDWEMRVAVDQSSGSIYVTNPNDNTVMKFDSVGNFLIQWGSLGTGNTNFNRPEGVAVDSSGFVYICDGDNRRIVKYNSDGNYQAKWGSDGSGIGQFQYPTDIAVDSSDNVYVLDRWNQSVQVFTSAGTFVRKWGSYGIGDGELSNPEGIGIDSADNVYVADSDNRRVVKFSSDGTFITKWGTMGSGDYNFDWPMDVAVDSSGYVYVADSGMNNRIMKFLSAWLPTVSITSPAAGATVSDVVTIQATAESGISISKVEFYIDEVLKSTDTESPYEYSWDTTVEVNGVKEYSNGEYEIKAVAYNTQNKSAEAEISVVVNDGGDNPPKLSITNPLDGATVMLSVTIKADASDFEGIDRVEFYVDDSLLGTDTESPYEYTWDATTVEDGAKTIKVVAYDTIGQTREATVNVTVTNNEEFGFLTKWNYDSPKGLAVDSEGFVYVAGGYKIMKFTPDGNAVLFIEEDWQSGDYWFSWNMHVAVDSEGNIYVSSEENNQIIKFDSSGKYLLKWGIQGYGDGEFNGPQGIDVDSEGNVYVCDQWNHRIMKFDSSGNYLKKFGDFQGWNQGEFSDPKDVAVDSSGNIYVADSGNNRIQVLSSDGTFLRMWGNWGFGDYQFDWPEGIALDSEGNVYVADTWNKRIVKYSSDGTFLAKWGSQGSGDYQFDEPRGIAVDSSFNVYVADSGWNNRIMKFRSTWLPSIEIINPLDNSSVSATVTLQASVDSTLEISTVEFYIDGTILGEDTSSPYSYDWDTTSESDGVHTIKATAYNLQNITADAEISVVVNNSGDEYPTISITNPADGAVVSVAVSIKAEASDDKGIAKVEYYVDDAKVGEVTSAPYELTWDATKVEDGTRTIKVVAYDTIGQNVDVSIEVTIDNSEEFSFVSKWNFDNPTSIALDKDGNLYVAGGNKVKKYKSDGTELLTIDDRKGMAEYRFDWDMYVTVDQSSGDIYVINQFESRVIRFSSEGKYITQWGSPGKADGEFNWPHGVATDSEGNVYVCDTDNKRVMKFDPEGNFLARWGEDEFGFSDVWLDGPQDIVLDESNIMYITEGWGHRVKVLSSEGTILDEWGEWGFDDTQFQDPKGIAFDSDGFLYVADSNNNRIVKYTTDGRFLTKWGSIGSGDENFSWPQDVAVDSFGYVYVADRNNNRIVKFKSAWLPAVEITNPIQNEFVSGAVAIQVSVDSALEISKVEFYIDETLLHEDTLTPYSYDWDTTSELDGVHTIKVIAYTVQGKSQDAEITVVVNNSNDAIPEVSITSPEEGAALRRTAELQAEASDDVGIAKVEFYAGEILLFSDTESPYEYEWDTETVDDGENVIKAIAYDTIGQNVEASVSVTVRNTDSYAFLAEYKTDWEQEHGYGNPDSITIDQYGRVYVTFHERIAMFTEKGNFLGVLDNEGNNDEYKLTHDMHLAVDKYGDIYVSCPGTFKILKFDSSGNYLTEWGSQGSGPGEFSRPQGIAVDSEGYVYVCDGWNHNAQYGNRKIVKFDSEGTYITEWGNESSVPGGPGEPPPPPPTVLWDGQFDFLENPMDIAIDASGNIYVVDGWRHRIVVFDTEGTFLRTWGDWGYGDLQFQNPEGIDVDDEGYIYVADTGNHRIVKYSSEGIFRGKWGSQGYGEYSFEWPRDVAVSPSGYVFVADNNNQRIVIYQMKGMPTVSITNPTEDSTVSGEVAIQLTAESEYGISKVEVYVDGTLTGEATLTTSPSYEYTWDTTLEGNGSHDIEAVAYNSDGTSASSEITVIVNNGGDAAPTLSITSPKDGAIIRGVVNIKTQVSDDVGIDKVEFCADETLLHTLTELPFEYSWDSRLGDDGQKEIKVIATDTIGQKTWATVSVTVDNENRIFSINLTGAAVIYLTKDHTLKKLDTNGYEGYVINENVKVQQFQFDPLGNIYIVFENHQQLADGESYILAKVNPATNEVTGIDSSLNNLVWNDRSISNNLQFDQEGNVYYFAESQTDEGEWERVLRRYVDKDNIEDIINRNMQIYHWQVRNDGTIVIAGKTLSNNETWLRKVDPDAEESKVQNLAEPDWYDEWGWMAKFPDDLIYITLTGSYLNLDGIYKLGDDLHRLQEEDALAPYIGDMEGSEYRIDDLTADHSDEYIKGITEQGRVRDMISIQTDDSGNVYGLCGHRDNKYRTVMRLYPVPEIIEPQLIDRAQMMTVSLNQLVIAGFDNQNGTYKLILYDISTRTELNLMYQNIEIYHLGALSTGSILFDGLNLDTNKVIIGMFERAAAASSDMMSVQSDDFGLTVLSEIGSEADKPLGFGVIKDQSASSDILLAAVSSPSHGAKVSDTVEIKATATAEYGVSKVEFYIDGQVVETDTDSPYSYSWDTTSYSEGSHIIKVIVYDTQDQTASSQITVTVANTPGDIELRESELYFGAAAGGRSTSSQTVVITNTGGQTLNWTATPSKSWLGVSPTSGTGAGKITISVDTAGLSEGTHTGTIEIADSNATNSPQTVNVTLEIYSSGSTQEPFGAIDTPEDGTSGVSGAIPVSGWALDDIEVTKIELWRDPVEDETTAGNGLVYIGEAALVEGARSDIEQEYSDYPFNYQAGWGYMLLTNYLPDQGNGTYTIYAVAYDREGNGAELGTTTISCDNSSASKPFGAIDTPTQGGEASGSAFINFGWALTPQPNSISEDGSTISVCIDGEELGNPEYNQYRSDVAELFPGYANSDGAVGYYYIDTTAYESGVHTITWSVEDSAGSTADDIGTRYFTIFNTETAGTLQIGMRSHSVNLGTRSSLEFTHNLLTSFDPLRVTRGYSRYAEPEIIAPDNYGTVTLEIREVERVEIELGEGAYYKGYMIVGDKLRPLPIGSTFNTEYGTFSWQPGPGFIGKYDFIFLAQDEAGLMRRISIRINIAPKFGIY